MKTTEEISKLLTDHQQQQAIRAKAHKQLNRDKPKK